MPKCCKFGIPNDPEGDVVRFTFCVPDQQPCPKLAAFRSMGSTTVKACADCRPPTTAPKPRLRCCMYGIPRDPAGRVVRWRICLPAKIRCPRIPGLLNLGSRLVTSCKDCCGPTKPVPVKPSVLAKLRAAARKGKRSAR